MWAVSRPFNASHGVCRDIAELAMNRRQNYGDSQIILFMQITVCIAAKTTYGPFLLKLPYYHQNMTLVLDIFCFYKFYICLHDNGPRCIYLNQGHFVTKLNNGFLISGRTFYPQKFITVTMEKCNC